MSPSVKIKKKKNHMSKSLSVYMQLSVLSKQDRMQFWNQSVPHQLREALSI